MAGVNKVIIVGRLGQNPEMRTMPNGKAVANLSVATSETWNDKQTGERREQTEWHRIIFFDRLAEICGQYLQKGSQIYIEGKLQTRKWQDQQGQDRYTTEIIGSVLQMLGGGQQQNKPQPQNKSQPQNKPQNQEWNGYADNEFAEDDMPF